MKITITPNPEETAAIKALAIRYGVPVERIVSQFISDLAGSLRSGGSDERELARRWISRGFTEDPMPDVERDQMERLEAESAQHRRASQWRVEREMQP